MKILIILKQKIILKNGTNENFNDTLDKNNNTDNMELISNIKKSNNNNLKYDNFIYNKIKDKTPIKNAKDSFKNIEIEEDFRDSMNIETDNEEIISFSKIKNALLYQIKIKKYQEIHYIYYI